MPRALSGAWGDGEPRGLAAVVGVYSRHVGGGGAETLREGRPDGGREATWVGFRPGSACPPPRVTSLPLSSSPRHHVRRRRRGRAQCSRRAPTPPFWGAGAYRAEAGAFPHPGPPSLHPLQGSHPRGSQEGIPDGTFLKKPNYPEFQAPGGLTDVPGGPSVLLGLRNLVFRLTPTISGEPTLPSNQDTGYKILTWLSEMTEEQRILISSKAT